MKPPSPSASPTALAAAGPVPALARAAAPVPGPLLGRHGVGIENQGLARRLREDQRVMDDGSTARFHLGRLNPLVFREAGVDDKKLVIDRPGRLHFEGLGNREDDVRLRNAPALGKSGRRGRILGIAFGRAGLNPVGDRLLLLGSETAVVGKVAILRIGVPGGHAPLAHDLIDGVGPANRFLVRGERERADFSGPVALDAMLVKNPGDIFREGHRSRGGRLVYATDETAHCRCRRLADRFARQQFIECRRQVVLRRLCPRNADVVLIVDPPAIADRSLAVQDENFRGALDSQLVGQDVIDVFQDGELDAGVLGKASDLRNAVLLIGVDTQELHALGLVSLGQLGQARSIKLGHRTFAADERQHDRLFRRELLQRRFRATVIAQRE